MLSNSQTLVLAPAILLWTDEQQEINARVGIDAGLVYMPGQKSFIGNRRPGFYLDKYGMHVCIHVASIVS